MSEPSELERENAEDREALQKSACRFVVCLEGYMRYSENPRGVPQELVSRFLALLSELCEYSGHLWELDKCGWLDHAYCMVCRIGCRPEHYEELRTQMPPSSKVSPLERRYKAWSEWEEKDE